MADCWAEGGIDHIAPLNRDLRAPDELRSFFSQTFTAMPDMRFEVLDVVAARNQAAVRWRATGTFCGGPFEGIEPTGVADRARGHRPADGRGRQDPAQRRLLRQRPVRARGRAAAARGQHDGAAHGGRLQRAHAAAADALQAELQPGRRGRVAGAGRLPAEGHERLPDRGRGPGDRLRRRHQGDDERHRARPPPASGGIKRDRARPRAPGPPRRGARARRAGLLPSRRGRGDPGRRRRALLRLLEARLVRAAR